MGLSLRELRAATDEILAFADLERFANLELRHYSSGMAARLAYAVAFRAVREVLILDEIFAVGDAGFKERCEEKYRELHRSGRSMLLVSHDPRIIGEFCDRALLLEHGRIVLDAPGAQVGERYLSLFDGYGNGSSFVGAKRLGALECARSMRVRRTLLYYRLLGDKDTMPPLTPQRLISAACEADLGSTATRFAEWATRSPT